MAHHAFFSVGDRETGIAAALSLGESLGIVGEHNPDRVVFRYGLFSVDDARRVIRIADQAPLSGDRKIIVIAVERLFHEAQNALLKLFEEPPAGTTLVLIVPTEGILLPTLRSRLLPLPVEACKAISPEAAAYLEASASEREKVVAKLLDRAKSDKDEEKQAARGEALRLAEGLLAATYTAWQEAPREDLRLFMRDLERFIPILHERSAPLKLIFEHMSLTVPPLPKRS